MDGAQWVLKRTSKCAVAPIPVECLTLPQCGMNSTTDGSDSQGEQAQEYIEEVFECFAVNCVNLAVFVLLLFEHLITLECEVRFAWCRKLSWARVILLVNRYVSLLYFLLSLAPLLPEINSLLYGAQLHDVGHAPSSILRLGSGNNRLVTCIVVLLALVPVATNLYLEDMSSVQYTPDGVCTLTTSFTPTMFHNWTVTILTRASLIASEAIVIVVTWMKTCRRVHAGTLPTTPGGTPMTFTRLVLREGIVYFCVVLSLNIVQLVFTFLEGSTLALALQILDVLTPILISRFYFNLGELKDQEAAASTLPSVHSTTTLRFASEYAGSGSPDEDEDGDEGSLSDIVFGDEVDSPPANASWPAKQVVYA
ncbi:hypothetical protein PYCCODRAFT_1427422 [Trametes coccinea BRFM310]|uniref:DUF6533 domain-containing protein n=1 Tax=Trametes coccinea (strain BRFM310) TaxID=1353009 RepID=A0A1Y2ID73_TRAC3|nr:hypothetical protein PYCCODRAFT_1427422 [Trametes coccinea BRFM310]